MTNKKELKKRDRQLDKSRHRMKIEKATGFRTDRKKIKNTVNWLKETQKENFKSNWVKENQGKKLKMGTENWIKVDVERKFKKQRH